MERLLPASMKTFNSNMPAQGLGLIFNSFDIGNTAGTALTESQ